MDTSITTKGQVVIPARFRKKLGFNPGTKVHFEETEHGLMIIPSGRVLLSKLKGSIKEDLLSELVVLREEERRADRT